MGVGAAIIGGSLISGVLGSKAASKSADAQAQGQQQNIREQRRQFNVTRKDFRPFQQAGVSAINEQQSLLGLQGEESQQASFDAFNQSPGQQFLRDRAQKNLVRNSSAIGGLGGGNVRSALVQQGVGFAQQDFQNQFGRLGQLSGQGQAATTAVGQFGAQSAGNIGNSLVASGNARASGIVNQNNAIQNAFGGAITGAAQGGFFGGSGNQFTQSGGQSPNLFQPFNPIG